MYIAKVYFNGRLLDAAAYHDYEHFLSDLSSGSPDLFGEIPDRTLEHTDFARPKISTCSQDNTGFGVDFEYSYPAGITVACGRPAFRDEAPA